MLRNIIARNCTSIRALHSLRTQTIPHPIPKQTEQIPDVASFLKTIGRNCNEFVDTYENQWDNLFKWDSRVMKEKGIPTQQRKYILFQLEKFRDGEEIIAINKGKKSFFGGERTRKEKKAKWLAEQRQNEKLKG
ncbi:similar to Saccharomyces cerevisiae YHR059W FYV4 Protein of unknown function, required for survival upon exposure to K1 killer toxin [Maudiozyma barnettii]|uniref:Small ribosomal subunit protein mS41 n=1 Tax=Maudiozyma barnettii TaxID=61262 RepID=A0A8H2VBS8_9SACH|nr:Fyv4p [Kazachstania barnettii]CAB4252361.1 similar to Saccharomyces cerevisiae YHR059W FYV4 Protein of unknown function, required for survival upon exposure to K1 killer toxin [Kazachstania barnettii]CAD1779095.1 similar to Saccharomyces cerevisiae YHR059W FYV4 Protein of unknown function, required for survival upon exposure to K1 killer toxin [Kazachstania barnettii]